MAEKVSVTPIKRPILKTQVGGSVQVAPRYAKILKKMKLVSIDGAAEEFVRQARRVPGKVSGNPLAGVEFASDVAAELAMSNGLTAKDLSAVEPGARGYTKSQVAEASEAKGRNTYRRRDLTAE